MKNPGQILAAGLMTCPHCTAQREARLKAELQANGAQLVLARALRGVKQDGEAEFKRLYGVTLDAYIAARKAAARGPA